MAVIKWLDGYKIEVDQFDMEHHKMVELIDTMFAAILDKRGKEITENVCREVIAYTGYHFDNEEKAMQAINYPGLEEHIAEHRRLKVEALKFQEMVNTNFPEGTTEFYKFLRTWLMEHIQDCDKKYGLYLKDVEDS